MATNLSFFLEPDNLRRSFSTNTKGGAVLQITYLDTEPWPSVVCAKLILDCGKAHPRVRSITRLMRKNVAMRTAIENEVISYLEDRNNKIQAEAYSDYQNAFNYQEIN